MNFQLALIGIAIHTLFWDKMPNWGTWFNKLLGAVPQPLQTLYQDWNCAFCAGFWIAIVLHALTGLWTIPSLANLAFSLPFVSQALGWFLDALATAMLIYIANLALNAISGLAIQGHKLKQEFLDSQ